MFGGRGTVGVRSAKIPEEVTLGTRSGWPLSGVLGMDCAAAGAAGARKAEGGAV